MISRIKLAITKPYLIKDAIFKQHLGLILQYDVDENIFNSKENDVSVKESLNINEIVNFYQQIGRSTITTAKVEKWLKEGHRCWVAYDNDKVIGSAWTFFGEIEIPQLSARAISEKKILSFNEDTAYLAYVNIKHEYRGKRVYPRLQQYMVRKFADEGKLKRILLTTGAENGSMIKSVFRMNGQLVGIVKLKNKFGLLKREVLFMDRSKDFGVDCT